MVWADACRLCAYIRRARKLPGSAGGIARRADVSSRQESRTLHDMCRWMAAACTCLCSYCMLHWCPADVVQGWLAALCTILPPSMHQGTHDRVLATDLGRCMRQVVPTTLCGHRKLGQVRSGSVRCSSLAITCVSSILKTARTLHAGSGATPASCTIECCAFGQEIFIRRISTGLSVWNT